MYDGDQQTGTKYFYLHDRLGSVRSLANATGDVVNRYIYEPYGKELTAEAEGSLYNPFLFTGQYIDAEIDQYWLRARQYDLAMMRFTSYDPVRGGFKEPLTLHRYLYCLNDPVNYTDPLGESAVMDIATGRAIVMVTILAAITYEITKLNNAHIFVTNLAISAIHHSAEGAMSLALSIHNAVFAARDHGVPIPKDQTIAPGPEWEWVGRGDPASGRGSWVNRDTGETLHPDLDHAPPIGPHWDYFDEDENEWRVYEDGTIEPKE